MINSDFLIRTHHGVIGQDTMSEKPMIIMYFSKVNHYMTLSL